jgi:hypothetical protein
MGTSSALPQKQDLPKEIWKAATTLSDDAQNAAMRKARELRFDLSILRHASISTTTAHYVFPNPDKTKAGLRKLAEAVRKTYTIKV